MTATVDAIVCYHNHADVIADCLNSLDSQVRRCVIVDDGSDFPFKFTYGSDTDGIPILRRDQQHSPANSFNYGAEYSTADWLLYVDPHNIYQPHAVQQMLALADQDGYDLILGTGTHYVLDATDPWIHALGPTLNTRTGPWTFLLRRRLWDQWQGIPEPRYAHMRFLAERLLRTGVLIGVVEGCCDHVVNRDWRAALDTFYTTGREYAVLESEQPDAARDANSIARIAAQLTPTHIGRLWQRVLTSLYLLGAVEGLGTIPQTAVPVDLTFQWRDPPSPGSA